uniref:Uncharacterized protein n=1 Tax=Anguilla anguilla TaxID=7936 RepID=A0A0E9WIA6_ANGAN
MIHPPPPLFPMSWNLSTHKEQQGRTKNWVLVLTFSDFKTIIFDWVLRAKNFLLGSFKVRD